MNGRLAKMMRREVRKRYKADYDKFVEGVSDLPFWFRVKFCCKVLIGRGSKRG